MTRIEWTEATWNPIVGCSIVSPGCTNCYAMRVAARLEAMQDAAVIAGKDHGPAPHYSGTTKWVNGKPVWTGKLALAPARTLTEPLRRRRPTTYFVNSMGDLFHEDVPDAWIDRVFAVMALSPHHTFQVLTKRAGRMREYMVGLPDHYQITERWSEAALDITGSPCVGHIEDVDWPLPNVWLGVSAERQTEADARIPDLLATPAAVRFVSAEPLLGPIDFQRVGWNGSTALRALDRPGLDWIIVGGESGPGARPMHLDWARSIRDQCQGAGAERAPEAPSISSGVPFFFKQWGEWAWSDDGVSYTDAATAWGMARFPMGTHFEHHACGRTAYRVGKKRAGRLLDGREWNETPALLAPSGAPCPRALVPRDAPGAGKSEVPG